MARPPSPTLTDGELRLMRVLWTRGAATVADIVGALDGRDPPAYNTVLTLLQVMERKGYVKHRTSSGRAFTFVPCVDEEQVRRRALRYVLRRFFDNRPSLLLSVLRDEPLDEAELARIRDLVERAPSGRAKRARAGE